MKKSKKHINNHGFTLIEVLVGLCCLSFSLLLFTALVQLLKNYPKESYLQDDVYALRQLRLILAESNQIQYHPQTLTFWYRGQETSLQVHDQRVVKRPGYEIFIKDIDAMSFTKEGACVYVNWSRLEKEEKAVLYCE